MHIKFKICHFEPNPKNPKQMIPKCITIEGNIPDLPAKPPKNPFPATQVIPPALKAAKEKGLSSDAEKDIQTLWKIAAQASDIHSPGLQREFAAFARNAIKHIKLPEGITLTVEEA